MSSRWIDRLRYALSFRLALWYGVLFVVSATALVGLTYLLLARSLEASDHQVIQSTLERYATEYRSGGLAGLNRAIGVDRLAGRHERLFVRVVGASAEAIFFNIPVGWQDFDFSRSGAVGRGRRRVLVEPPKPHADHRARSGLGPPARRNAVPGRTQLGRARRTARPFPVARPHCAGVDPDDCHARRGRPDVDRARAGPQPRVDGRARSSTRAS